MAFVVKEKRIRISVACIPLLKTKSLLVRCESSASPLRFRKRGIRFLSPMWGEY
jgi:hypothetical protein